MNENVYIPEFIVNILYSSPEKVFRWVTFNILFWRQWWNRETEIFSNILKKFHFSNLLKNSLKSKIHTKYYVFNLQKEILSKSELQYGCCTRPWTQSLANWNFTPETFAIAAFSVKRFTLEALCNLTLLHFCAMIRQLIVKKKHLLWEKKKNTSLLIPKGFIFYIAVSRDGCGTTFGWTYPLRETLYFPIIF